MELKKYNINGTEFSFVNIYESNRYGFKHRTTLFINGIEKHSNSIQYINRTWEKYDFQSVMIGCIDKFILVLLDSTLDEYKKEKGISRFKTADRNSVIDRFYNLESIKKLKELIKQLN